MAFENLVQTNSFVSTNTLTNQFVGVIIDPANPNSVILPLAAGSYCIGVTQDTPSAGDPTAVCTIGSVTKILCGGNVAVGQDISFDINGEAIAAVSGDFVMGTALTLGQTGYLCTMLYQPRGAKGIT